MANEGRQDTWAFEAGADLTAHQYRAVKVDAAGKIVAAAAGERAFILVDTPDSGEWGTVVVGGVTKAAVGAAVAPMDPLTPDANGELIPAAAGEDAIVAVALTAATNADELVTVVATQATQYVPV